MAKNWIISTDAQIGALVELAHAHGGTTTVVLLGTAPISGVDEVIAIDPAGKPVEAFAPVVAELVAAGDGDLVLAPNRPAERVLAGAVAARLDAPLLLGLKAVSATGATLSRFGGITTEEVTLAGPAVAVLDGGGEVAGEAVAPTSAAGDGAYAVSVEGEEVSATEAVNLGAAKRIVAAGRGFAAEEDLQLARDLAAALGGALAASRPLAEGAGWMPHDSYIGVTGQHVSPELYVAAGISGQLQHTAGMVDSGCVVAINKDENAPIFELADYGIVGDLYEVLPALTAALK
ncbi:electron transfer flavoprotein alpha subunit [Arcanobacterium wilhelmae]|uniref:Electron transfer flavoprotein alpha subunit n=1 Tax=Arcanobacterium wilhelmae TaxID=1803177 RepID=A0ABT9NAK5_9ACTO|nr:electron transfer flavoprotein subunit alpha/FixB family protein [Arcanobacterium wilhelmae]MDP9800753.1 electron transfer flavoprotein alpha subunit [Arcanobacterium wilhelmae]